MSFRKHILLKIRQIVHFIVWVCFWKYFSNSVCTTKPGTSVNRFDTQNCIGHAFWHHLIRFIIKATSKLETAFLFFFSSQEKPVLYCYSHHVKSYSSIFEFRYDFSWEIKHRFWINTRNCIKWSVLQVNWTTYNFSRSFWYRHREDTSFDTVCRVYWEFVFNSGRKSHIWIRILMNTTCNWGSSSKILDFRKKTKFYSKFELPTPYT